MYWITSLEGGPQRVNHAACSVGNKIYSFGGYNSDEAFEINLKIDIHVFDTYTYKWRPVLCKNASEAPRKCYGHTVVAFKSKIYLWGGRNNLCASNTLYCFDTETLMWKAVLVTGSVPKKIDGHSACVIDSFMYIFGGFDAESEQYVNSVYRLNLSTFKWEKIKTKGVPPSPRDFHTASVIGDKMYIFGGRSGENDGNSELETYDNDIIYLDTKTMMWVKPNFIGKAPCGRRSHSAVVYNNEIYIVGGFDGETKYHLSDIFKFNPVINEWFKMNPKGESPCPRRRHCSCIVGDQLYLFGGSSPLDEDEYAIHYQNGGDNSSNYPLQLLDHSDLYILDFFPTLKRLSQLQIIKSKLDISFLPKILKSEIMHLTTDKMLKLFFTTYPRKDYPALSFSA